MDDKGYADHQIAEFVSFRFLAVMFFALPFGLFIKGQKLKPFFYVASVALPTTSLILLYLIDHQMDAWLYPMFVIWGVSFSCLQVTALPYILLNADPEYHSEAISVSFQTWGISIFSIGLLNFFLKFYFPELFDIKTILYTLSIMGFGAIYFVSRIKVEEKTSEPVAVENTFRDYDWGVIAKVLTPTFIIAIGAGFTIPFINLFFLTVHGVEEDIFSLISALAYILVAIGMLIIPGIRKRYGYKVSITLIQSLAVVALILMATTEYYSDSAMAVWIAIAFFIFRQPLMNMAGPMATELSMYYVGKRNQEIVSALNASIWSGSWFVSAQIFKVLREQDLSYMNIFLITAAFYAAGVVAYYLLIESYYKRKAAGQLG